PHLVATPRPTKATQGALPFLDQQAAAMGRGRSAGPPVPKPALPVPEGELGIESPHAGALVEIRIAEGDAVKQGDVLFVVSAMKMETSVTAPSAGHITSLARLASGEQLEGRQILATPQPVARAVAKASEPADEGWQPMLDQVDKLRAIALKRLAPGSREPGVVRQRDRGKLTCRERIDQLLDPGSFREVGS